MRSDITPGGIFPDFALPDQVGSVRTLGELQGRDPLILTQSSHAQTGKTTTACAGRPELGARGSRVEHLADVDAERAQLITRRVDVGNDQIQALSGARRRRRDPRPS